MTVDMTARPAGYHFSAWAEMSRRERAHACWLLLRAGWKGVDLTTATSFDTDSQVVVVDGPHDGRAIWSICAKEADESLARIEEKFGTEARRWAEEVIGA